MDKEKSPTLGDLGDNIGILIPIDWEKPVELTPEQQEKSRQFREKIAKLSDEELQKYLKGLLRRNREED